MIFVRFIFTFSPYFVANEIILDNFNREKTIATQMAKMAHHLTHIASNKKNSYVGNFERKSQILMNLNDSKLDSEKVKQLKREFLQMQESVNTLETKVQILEKWNENLQDEQKVYKIDYSKHI